MVNFWQWSSFFPPQNLFHLFSISFIFFLSFAEFVCCLTKKKLYARKWICLHVLWCQALLDSKFQCILDGSLIDMFSFFFVYWWRVMILVLTSAEISMLQQQKKKLNRWQNQEIIQLKCINLKRAPEVQEKKIMRRSHFEWRCNSVSWVAWQDIQFKIKNQAKQDSIDEVNHCRGNFKVVHFFFRKFSTKTSSIH